MIRLERVRLVNWHYFEDLCINIGERCLFAGDNGSGKSTIIDAIQFALAADLRKVRFNAAAADRRGGRDLAGYIRCKLGSDDTEYLRGDTVGHVMLEFSGPGKGFSAGVCVEAFSDGRLTEWFWVGDGLPVDSVEVREADGTPLVSRQYRDRLAARSAGLHPTPGSYLRELTGKLGVWRRMTEYNPYLEAFTRSVSFTPLVSVDKFVCDYILDDWPVEITVMKKNLESYKEAEREARAVKARIGSLTKLCEKAREWQEYRGQILRQDYLKLKLDWEKASQEQQRLSDRLKGYEEKQLFLEREIQGIKRLRFELEQERQSVEAALAANDAHLLYRRLEEQIGRLSLELEGEEKKAGRYDLLRSQCEALLGRGLDEDPEKEIPLVEEGERKYREEKDAAKQMADQLRGELRDVLEELSDLEKGIARYPENFMALHSALNQAGISAHFLADTAEVISPEWADAVEGWLNTRRFALLVDPEEFQQALDIYDSLPRKLAGALLPNLGKMRRERAKSLTGTLAELVSTDSPYAKIYIEYILGDVVTADIASLKDYPKAVTRECMTYANHTASRIKEEVYHRHYLGRAAKEKRKHFLLTEADRLRREQDEQEEAARRAGESEELYHRAYRALLELTHLLPSVIRVREITGELERTRTELAGVDTSGFRELQTKRDTLTRRFREEEDHLEDRNKQLGSIQHSLEETRFAIEALAVSLEGHAAKLREFGEAHPTELGECEAYASDRLRRQSIGEILANFESAYKGLETRRDNSAGEYRSLAQAYDREFNALLSIEPAESAEAETLLKRLTMSELPEYQEKIVKARQDAEREFKDDFIAHLNERIETARESFREINDTLKSLTFGRDQYRFTLEERSDRRGQIETIRRAAEISSLDGGLFSQFTDEADRVAAQNLFDHILNADLDSPELRSICDYRTYFTYDIKIRDTESIDRTTGKAMELSLSKVLREKSGGESQTPYYVAIAASFYRFFKNRPEETIRLVMFDEAFDRLDDERIGTVLDFYRRLDIQIIGAVPTVKIEAIVPHMDRVNLVIRHGRSATIREAQRNEITPGIPAP